MNAESVADFLERKGVDATIKVWGTETFDPTTNETTLASDVDHAVKIIPPYQVVDEFGKTTFVTEGKGMTGLANYNLGFTLKKAQEITLSGVIWVIDNIQPLQNNEGVLCYILGIHSK